ncbi:MAG: ribulose-phosphate 3-epimerase, partial [Propionibacteriaceae bacterium]|nr:ribulose-phosphate 3-epimerase [Propionibacteriaceae bacterium]
TIERAAEAGADTFVAGSAVYRSGNPDHVVASLRNRALAAQVCAH